mmetsp:Transcript_58059/g.155127  ORF Transcript_58059/g.155127 Transcript_58059/m.155127 type:complete len:657 (-) Transcript_58059:73-2043(-)
MASESDAVNSASSTSGRPKKSKTTWRQGDHLAGFQFQKPPDQSALHQPSQSSRPRRKASQSASSSWYPGWGKTRWLQGACRIVVRADFSEAIQSALFDPDAQVPWPDVRRIELQTEEFYTCPICLDTELCVPKITQCGHVFCLPCIMRYFSLADCGDRGPVTRRCPLCGESCAESDLRSVRLQLVDPVSDGSKVNFVLCCRSPSVMLPGLAPGRFQGIVECHSLKQEPLMAVPEQCYQFSKIAQVTDEMYHGELLLELEALDAAYAQSIDDPEALSFIAKGREHVEAALVSCSVVQRPAKPRLALDVYVEPVWPHPVQSSPAVSPGSCSVPSPAISPDPLELSHVPELLDVDGQVGIDDGTLSCEDSAGHSAAGPHRAVFASDGNVYFYQEWSGQNVFLDPFAFRLAAFEAGQDLVNLPAVLEVHALSRQTTTLDYDLRKKYRAVSHLALGSTVTLVDVRPRELRLSRRTYQFFEQQIRARARQYAQQRRRDRETEMVLKAKSDEEAEEHLARLKAMAERFTGPVHNDRLPTDEDFVPLSTALAVTRTAKSKRREERDCAEEGLLAQAIQASLADESGGAPNDADQADHASEELSQRSWADKVKVATSSRGTDSYPALQRDAQLQPLISPDHHAERGAGGTKKNRKKKGQTFTLFG